MGLSPSSSRGVTLSSAAGGDLTGTYPDPTLGTAGGGAAGPTGSATVTPIVTVDAKGRVTALSSVATNPTAGAGGAMTLLDTQTAASPQATLDFQAISGAYKHLRIVAVVRGDTAATTADLYARFNNDSSGNYDWLYVRGNNVSSSVANTLADTNGIYLFSIPAATATAALASSHVVDIPGYAGTTFNKTAQTRCAVKTSAAAASLFVADLDGFWRSTAAITRVTLRLSAGNFDTGSQASLYGIG